MTLSGQEYDDDLGRSEGMRLCLQRSALSCDGESAPETQLPHAEACPGTGRSFDADQRSPPDMWLDGSSLGFRLVAATRRGAILSSKLDFVGPRDESRRRKLPLLPSALN